MGEDDGIPEDGPEGAAPSELEVELFALLHADRVDEAHRLLTGAMGFLERYIARCHGPELGGRAVVQEVVHEAVCRAIERIEGYRPERGGSRFWTWKIAMNLVADRLKSERARAAREQPVARSEAIRDLETESDLREAITQLDEPCRALTLLDLEHGGRAPMSVLVERFGLARQTLYNLRGKARERLRELLA